MTSAALWICIGLVLWLLVKDGRRPNAPSPAAWIPAIWAMVGASRPVSSWFSSGANVENVADAYDAGNPLERYVYLIMICIGVVVLLRRRVEVGSFVRTNLVFFFFTVFWGLSAFWADDATIAFKRWFKDSGTIVMVLIVLTETDPVEAVKSVFLRCAYVLIPFSLLLIRYYGDLGRSYSRWTGELMNVGVTAHKSSLGILTLVCILALAWDLLERFRSGYRNIPKSELYAEILVFLMSWYVLQLAHSATSLVCAVLGCCLLVGLRLPVVQRNIGQIELYAFGFGLVFLVLDMIFDVKTAFLDLLGKDPTLTTRTEIWPILLGHQGSPILGSGFRSFWSGSRLDELWNKYGIIQAHNGYLETYLNGGLMGAGLLVAFLVAGWRRIKKELLLGTEYSVVRLTFWLVAIIHNYTEASFNTFSPIWILLLMVSIELPDREGVDFDDSAQEDPQLLDQTTV